jgi:hypothetical protein
VVVAAAAAWTWLPPGGRQWLVVVTTGLAAIGNVDWHDIF